MSWMAMAALYVSSRSPVIVILTSKQGVGIGGDVHPSYGQVRSTLSRPVDHR